MNSVGFFIALVTIVTLVNGQENFEKYQEVFGKDQEDFGKNQDDFERVVGGTDAKDGQYPYQVSLQRSGQHFCGGSIIDKSWIITAAHCVYGQSPFDIDIVVGATSLKEGGKTYKSNFFQWHEKWSMFLIKNDIALIRLTQDLEFNKKIQPISLPTSNFEKVNYPAVLTGWGRIKFQGKIPDRLQQIELTVISQLKCKLRSILAKKTNICTLAKRGEGACNGDSGGPLVSDGELIGIVSYGKPCARGKPDVFTRVWNYISWIKETIEINTI